MKCTSWKGHKWSNWGKLTKTIEQTNIFVYETRYLQRRQCERCGLIQTNFSQPTDYSSLLGVKSTREEYHDSEQ